jgi:hypothetical protein
VPELVILEILAGLFLLLPMLRLLIENWQPLEGLFCLPPLSLLIMIGIFPAYGFRPECLPLLVYCAIYNVGNFPAFSAVLSRAHNPGFRSRNRFLSFLSLFFLAVSLAVAVIFVPLSETRLLSAGVASFALTDERRGETLFLRVYTPPSPEPGAPEPGGGGGAGGTAPAPLPRPVLLLVPPVMGSVPVVDLLCGALRDEGFTVITWSRPGFDSPAVDPAGKKRFPPLKQGVALWRALLQGRAFAGANEAGRALEAGRREDAEFLLAYAASGRAAPGMAPPEVIPDLFAAGFGAGGAALLDMGGESGGAARFPPLRGIIALESPLFSALRQEEPFVPPERGAGENWFRSVWAGFIDMARSRKPRRITGVDAVPEPGLPVCFITSDRVRYPAYRDTRYAALIRCFRAANVPAALVSVSGAGYLDYSDIPGKYPLVRFPFRGKNYPVWPANLRVSYTAALITAFAAAVAGKPEEPGDTRAGADTPAPSPRAVSARGIVVETNGVWYSRGFGAILDP